MTDGGGARVVRDGIRAAGTPVTMERAAPRAVVAGVVAVIATGCSAERRLGVFGDTEGASAEGATARSARDNTAGADAAGDEPGRLDVADGADRGGDDEGRESCEGREDGSGGVDFSYIWVANSEEGTVSKINTRTLEEEARYLTRPAGSGDPSRTSVGLGGDVVVANRNGGLTKFLARTEDCVESNGMSGIQTSTGPDDVLAFGEDECMAWMADTGFTIQRPVAWTAGTFNPTTCRWEDAFVWTTGNQLDPSTLTKPKTVAVMRLRGDDGTVDAHVEVVGHRGYLLGPYGGAADGEGNFWFIQHLARPTADMTLSRVDAETLDIRHWDLPSEGYGIAMDPKGRPWIAGNNALMRFDPATETWALSDDTSAYGRGLMADQDGRMWVSNPGIDNDTRLGLHEVRGYDLESMRLVQTWNPPVLPQFTIVARDMTKGVSVDFDGFVWVVGGPVAFRIDPDTGESEHYAGLSGAYTYSDMTGWGLRGAAGLPPPAG